MEENAPTSWFARPRVRRWLKRSGIGLASLFLIYVIGGFVGVPLIVKHVAIAKIERQINGSLETGNIRFNPFSWVLEIEDFEGRTAQDEVAASFAKFRVNLQPSSFLSSETVVREILLDQPKGLVQVDSDGQLNLISLFGPKDPKPKDPDAEPLVIPDFVIERLEVRDASLELKLEPFEHAFERTLENISFVMTDLRSQAEHDNPYHFHLVSARGEEIQIEGSLRLDPLSTTGKASLRAIQLPDFTSFSGSLLDARIGSGVLDLSFDYHFQPLQEPARIGIDQGQLALKNFELHRNQSEVIQRIDSLTCNDFHLDVAQRRAGMDSLELQGAKIGLQRDRSGVRLTGQRANPASGAKSSSPSSKAAGVNEIVLGVVSGDRDIGEALTEAKRQFRSLTGKSAEADQDDLRVKIGKLVVRKGEVLLTDRVVQPTASIGLAGITLDAGPYQSKDSKPLNFKLDAALAGEASGELDARGEFLPQAFGQATQLTIQLDQVAMPPFTPYISPAIGRAPTQGQLSATLSCSIQGSMLDCANDLTIQGLKLGPPDPSAKAPKLPLDLAIAILQDSKGTIEFDLPIKGDLSNPKFSFGGVTSRAIANLITKVVSSPFRILGNLIPGGKQLEKGFVAFEEGEASLSEDAKDVLEALAEVMKARPRLELELNGCYSDTQDGRPLAKRTFEERLAELTADGKSHRDAIKTLYKKLPKDSRETGWFLPETDQMEETLRHSLSSTKDELRALADQRVKEAVEHLVKAGVSRERIELKKSKKADAPGVDLALDIDS